MDFSTLNEGGHKSGGRVGIVLRHRSNTFPQDFSCSGRKSNPNPKQLERLYIHIISSRQAPFQHIIEVEFVRPSWFGIYGADSIISAQSYLQRVGHGNQAG